ncbi:hypothetical protein V6N11_067315 [Hibiscus sabdariffa]|uniref:Uncharacterized protein n=1 Tax=Hibiscus sabdariffa TaxID=183260 RepID=A0ABR2SQQ5_9ROSI
MLLDSRYGDIPHIVEGENLLVFGSSRSTRHGRRPGLDDRFFSVGVDPHLVETILDPSVLEGESGTFSGLQNIIKSSPTSAVAWVGEAGGAYNSGHNLVTDAFVFCFCALLWHQLMGRNVLSTGFTRTEKIRSYSYTHCAKQSKGITLLLINLDNSTTVQAKLTFNITFTLRDMHRSRIWHHKHKIHRTTIIKLPKRITAKITREECHLTAKDGNLQSQTMLLNGKVLSVNSSGSEPIMVAPLSIVFVHMPGVIVPACKVQS